MIRTIRAITLCLFLLTTVVVALGQNNSPFATQDPLAQALQQNSVYVGKTLRSQVDAAALEQIAQQEPQDRPLKIAVLNQLPPSGSRSWGPAHVLMRCSSLTLGASTRS